MARDSHRRRVPASTRSSASAAEGYAASAAARYRVGDRLSCRGTSAGSWATDLEIGESLWRRAKRLVWLPAEEVGAEVVAGDLGGRPPERSGGRDALVGVGEVACAQEAWVVAGEEHAVEHR